MGSSEEKARLWGKSGVVEEEETTLSTQGNSYEVDCVAGRRHRRRAVTLPLWMWKEGGESDSEGPFIRVRRGEIMDLSRGGVRLRQNGLRVSDVILMRINCGSARHYARGTVVWTTESQAGLRFEGPAGNELLLALIDPDSPPTWE